MTVSTDNTKKIIANEQATLQVDLYGGAIIDFHLNQHNINPLTFRFSSQDMPINNKKGAPYQGHFLCAGRWGKPTEGEIRAGIPNHGQIANMLWETTSKGCDSAYGMRATSLLEGLNVERSIQMADKTPAYLVSEFVSNINPLGRFYNLVQHPTLGKPFLDNSTVINCNAGIGYNNVFNSKPEAHAENWPIGICEDGSTINLSRPQKVYNSLFSFIIKKEEKYGWITAYSPKYHLIFGYIWLRKDYPWINLWQDWSADQIRYRGIEFGTTGIHKPFHQILIDNNAIVFGENTYNFIDAGEKIDRHYISFLHKIDSDFYEIDDVKIANGNIIIVSKHSDHTINISSILKKLDDF